MPKDKEQDLIQHLWRVISEMSRDMIVKSGSVQKAGVHRITDAVIRRIFALGAGSRRGRAARSRLRQIRGTGDLFGSGATAAFQGASAGEAFL